VRPFQQVRARTVDEALEALDRGPGQARIIAGGQDLLFRIKKQLVEPDVLVNVKGVAELDGLAEAADGEANGGRPLVAGSLLTLTQIARDPTLRARYTAVAEAAREVASPQIRNVGTLGGNLCQDVWCWYLQAGFPCWKHGGRVCDLVLGDARYYGSVFLGHRCQANHPSDVAPALVAFDAEAEIASPHGDRRIPLAELLPGQVEVDGVLQSHSLRANELLTRVRLPAPPADTRSTYRKFRVRGSWDFAIAAAAVRLSFDGATCQDARVVLGGVATHPYRAPAAEALLVGERITEELAAAAAAKATEGARPFPTNAYKVDVVRTLVKRAILQLAHGG
jgi:xanthine dehydrogenase YagS FAD-binding subunit